MTEPGRSAAAAGVHATRVWREGRGAPLVLLHCLGVDHRLWHIAGEWLPPRYALVSYDFPGHGTSPVPATPYTIEDLAAQLAALLDRERLPKVHLAGISLGGLVAQCFAATYPNKVDKLVLVDTTPRYTDEMRESWHVRAATARAQGVACMTERLLEIWFTGACIAENGAAVRYVRDCFARCAGEGYALACEALAAADLRPLLRSIRAKTLVICGREDIPSFIEAAETLAITIADAELAWLAPARHASILEQARAFCAELDRFLAA